MKNKQELKTVQANHIYWPDSALSLQVCNLWFMSFFNKAFKVIKYQLGRTETKYKLTVYCNKFYSDGIY